MILTSSALYALIRETRFSADIFTKSAAQKIPPTIMHICITANGCFLTSILLCSFQPFLQTGYFILSCFTLWSMTCLLVSSAVTSCRVMPCSTIITIRWYARSATSYIVSSLSFFAPAMMTSVDQMLAAKIPQRTICEQLHMGRGVLNRYKTLADSQGRERYRAN